MVSVSTGCLDWRYLLFVFQGVRLFYHEGHEDSKVLEERRDCQQWLPVSHLVKEVLVMGRGCWAGCEGFEVALPIVSSYT